MCLQAIAAGWLIYRLKGRFPLRMAGRDAMKNLSKFLGPTGDPARHVSLHGCCCQARLFPRCIA